MVENQITAAELSDADRGSYEKNILKYVGFLSMDEQSIYNKLKTGFKNSRNFLNGGHEGAERAAAFFLPDYMDEVTAVKEIISLISVRPLNVKFADDLSHRDYLGAIMNLGIERHCIGDIIADNESKTGYIFALKSMEKVIEAELTRIKHTSVTCTIEPDLKNVPEPKTVNLKVNIASERLDTVVSAVFGISRQKASALIDSEKVFISGRYKINSGSQLKEGDSISVRGFGKFIYNGISGGTKKGRLYAEVTKLGG